ncbi:MAG: conjugal transfer protein TraG N-terminal domain-containing protein [Gammaproteobacteria bacterium]
MDFYAYNSFDAAVEAFQRLALVFGHTDYLGGILPFAIAGVLIAALAMLTVGLIRGQGISLQRVWLPAIVGSIVMTVGVLKTSTIHVYDPVRNEYEPVGDVPDLIIMAAAIPNLVERQVVEIVDATSAYPYGDFAGGISFDVIYRSVTEPVDVDDYHVSQSVNQYIKDCAGIALTSAGYPTSRNQIKRDTVDLLAELAAMRSLSVFTLVFTPSDKNGLAVTCRDAFDDYIGPALNDPLVFEQAKLALCSRVGLNTSRPASAVKCDQLLASAMDLGFSVTAGSGLQYFRNIYLAQSMSSVMQSSNPDLTTKSLANRKLVAGGLGAGAVTGEWLSPIRGAVLAVALGMLPLVLLFVMTPLIWSVLGITAGLMIWLSLWGVADAITHQIAIDKAISYFAAPKLNDWKMGLDAIYMAPDASTKAMAAIGSIRGAGVGIASFITMALFGLSVGGMAMMAKARVSDVEHAGRESGIEGHTPEGQAQRKRELAAAQATETDFAMHGAGGVARAQIYQQSAATATGVATADHLRTNVGGGTLAGAVGTMGAINAGQTVGRADAIENLASAAAGRSVGPDGAYDYAQTIARADQAMAAGHSIKAGEIMQSAAHDGTVESGALHYSAIRAYDQYAETENEGRLAALIQDEHEGWTGNRPSYQEAFEELQRIKHSNSEGTINATAGDAQTMVTAHQLGTHGFKAEMMTRAGMAADIQNARGGSIDDGYEGLSQMEHASKAGAIDAVDGNPSRMRGMFEVDTTRTVAQNEALRHTAAQLGVSVDQISYGSGVFESANRSGEMAAANALPLETQVAAAEFSRLSSVTSNAERDALVAQMGEMGGQSREEMLKTFGSVEAARDYASANTMVMVAKKNGLGVQDVAIDQYGGGGFNVAINGPEDWERLQTTVGSSRFGENAGDILAQNDYQGQARVEYDPQTGTPLHTTVRSGSEVSLSESVMVDSGEMYRGNVSVDGGAVADAMNDDVSSAAARLTGQTAFTGLLRDIKNDGMANESAGIGVLQGVTAAYSAYGHLEEGFTEFKTRAFDVGASGSAGVPGASPIRGGVSGSASLGGSSQHREQQEFNVVATAYAEVGKDALSFAETDIRSESPKLEGRSFDDAVLERATEKMKDFHAAAYSKYIDLGRSAVMDGSDDWFQETYDSWVGRSDRKSSDIPDVVN